ncbi:MAG: hypothetical protein GAK45_00888 [Pseudomonas citronellolis]|nr:MAG: hypothetical protein GAK45_00888 [Pseudomonas citronellolis]
MKSIATRILALLGLVLLLGACQSTPAPSATAAAGSFDAELAAGHLEAAQLRLGQEQENPEQFKARRQQLADAYLQRSRAALQAGDVDGATGALVRARSLMPRAPALAADVQGIGHPKAAEQVNCTP